MRKLLYTAAGLAAIGGVALAQSVGWPPPGGMMAALGVYNSTPPVLTNAQVSPVQISAAGRLLVDAAVTGGGDATAANQVLQIAQETAFNTALGLMADAACATDNGTCTLLALTKRNNQRLTTILAGPLPVTGTFFQATQPVSIASAQVASGAYASGSLASGSVVDLVALSAPVAPATATATKSILLGAQATTAAVNPTTGQQSALSSDSNNNLLTSPGGAPNIATSQTSVTTGNISVASARAIRRAITITNVTGTSAIYCGNTGVATTTGTYLGATAGSSITLNTTAAVFCTVAVTTQTVTAVETY